MKYIMLLLIILTASISIEAQNITVNEDPAITQMMNKYLMENRSSNLVKGWRIQIITTSDRRAMERARSKFASMYPVMRSEMEHVSPYYKIKVGAWEDKLALHAFLLELKRDFPSAIPVMDDIPKTELISQ